MAGQLIKGMNLTAIQAQIGGLENDQIADFAFFMGDMNYRLAIDEEDDGQLRHTGMQKKSRTSEVVARQKNFVYPDIVKLAQTEADQFAKC